MGLQMGIDVTAYESAMRAFGRHARRGEDGTIVIDDVEALKREIADPIIFADFSRSLDSTNELIKRGEIKAEDVNLGTL